MLQFEARITYLLGQIQLRTEKRELAIASLHKAHSLQTKQVASWIS